METNQNSSVNIKQKSYNFSGAASSAGAAASAGEAKEEESAAPAAEVPAEAAGQQAAQAPGPAEAGPRYQPSPGTAVRLIGSFAQDFM